MVTRYGMSKTFGMVALETVTNQYLGGDTSIACSADTATRVDQEVIALIGQAYARAKELLEQDRAAMDRLSAYLLEKETITGEEFMEILDQKEGQPESLG